MDGDPGGCESRRRDSGGSPAALKSLFIQSPLRLLRRLPLIPSTSRHSSSRALTRVHAEIRQRDFP